ncbi:MAG: hypothetical protein GY710_24005 [Desulfobacteraceae bacterium]|nr:hypothetical protein [Desulfobacteraceae bacterium]
MKPNSIKIKDSNVLEGLMLNRFDPMLTTIIIWVAVTFGLVMTESFRNKTHANDLHGEKPGRAIDLRTWCYPEDLAYKIRDKINQKWIYDPNRPEKQVAIIHDVGKGLHFHIQTHPSTVRRV